MKPWLKNKNDKSACVDICTYDYTACLDYFIY